MDIEGATQTNVPFGTLVSVLILNSLVPDVASPVYVLFGGTASPTGATAGAMRAAGIGAGALTI